MTVLDWIVVAVYLFLLVGLGSYLHQYQDTTQDYFLADQSMAWWQTGFSTMATQLSAISFISAPAFVALAPNGGLKWLAYEFAVPLALIVVMVVIIPVLHRGEYISMHQYLGERFDEDTRSLVSGLFLLMRGLSSGVIVYAGAKVLAVAMSIHPVTAILLIGGITILYDVLGGIGVVIFSDVIQMGIIFLGLIYCGIVATGMIGWESAWNAFDPARTQILYMREYGLSQDSSYGFWPFLIGGFVLYVSYYGCDQSQVQREMSVEDEDDVRKSMLLNAFGRFPLVLVYCVVGVLVGGVYMNAPDVIAGSLGMNPDQLMSTLNSNPDYMLPYFIVGVLPTGITGLLMVAIMAALMSSLDSAMNSLSAITVRDFYREYVTTDADAEHYLNAGRLFTCFWGVFATGSAFAFHYWSQVQTVIEQINQVGNMFYGPLAAAFLLGILTQWIEPDGIKAGVVLGLLVSIGVWLYVPAISWLWWGPIGFIVTVTIAFLIRLFRHNLRRTEPLFEIPKGEHETNWTPWYLLCILYFFVIVGTCYGLQTLLQS
jgi:SSS family solute:Na+ symporter